MTGHSDDRSTRWEDIERLARRLARDPELALAFERTPGKVLQQLGIPASSVPDVLATMAGTTPHDVPPRPGPPRFPASAVPAAAGLSDLEIDTSVPAHLVASATALEGRDHLQRFDRIVVLMQENRSFDHMLGYLSLPTELGGRGRNDVDGLDPERDVIVEPGRGHRRGVRHRIFALSDGVVLDNPGHSTFQVGLQIRSGAMDGFVDSYRLVLENAVADHPERAHESPPAIMGYHTAATVPVYDFLAAQFTVCDRYHSAIPGPTWPNRMFFYAGRANGKQENGLGKGTDGQGRLAHYREYAPGMPTDLVVHRLEAAGATWGVYRGSVMPWMAFFPSFRDLAGHRQKVKPYRNFDRDCRQGDLPDVVFIDGDSNLGSKPRHNNDDQAPSDVARGQELVGDIYENLRRHDLLDSTLFVVVYDEHGGFYDHVPPPALPAFAQTPPDAFTTYGVRVPALVASPWVDPGSVFSELLDHSSILHTILLRFCGGASMGPRTDVARNLGQLLTRSTKRASLPSAAGAIAAATAARSSREGNEDPTTAVSADLLAFLLETEG